MLPLMRIHADVTPSVQGRVLSEFTHRLEIMETKE